MDEQIAGLLGTIISSVNNLTYEVRSMGQAVEEIADMKVEIESIHDRLTQLSVLITQIRKEVGN